jgi:hypothetical protein
MLAASGLLFPAIYDFQLRDAAGHDEAKLNALGATENAISVEIAVVLFVAYVLMLVFSLRTHKHLYSAEESHGEPSAHNHGWPMSVAIGVLVGATVLVGVASEMLVGSIEATRKQFGWTEEFVGVIVVAIVGNAAEHSTAILVAMKNRMELAFQIAIGSGLQVAVFVAPVLVFVSLLPGFPERLNLVFTILETAAVLVSVLAISMVAHDGESNWLEGVLLLALYVILGIAFYNLPEQEHHKATEDGAAIKASGGREPPDSRIARKPTSVVTVPDITASIVRESQPRLCDRRIRGLTPPARRVRCAHVARASVSCRSRNCPQAASMSAPLRFRTVVAIPAFSRI